MYFATKACYDVRCYGVFEEWQLEETLERVEQVLGYIPGAYSPAHHRGTSGGMHRENNRGVHGHIPRQRQTENQSRMQTRTQTQTSSRRQRQTRGQTRRPVVVELEEVDDEDHKLRRRPTAWNDIEVEEVLD
jgi:hypothetical protein